MTNLIHVYINDSFPWINLSAILQMTPPAAEQYTTLLRGRLLNHTFLKTWEKKNVIGQPPERYLQTQENLMLPCL